MIWSLLAAAEWKTAWSLVCKIICWSESLKMHTGEDGRIWVCFETRQFQITEEEKEFLKSWDTYGVMDRV